MKLQNKNILVISPEPWDHIFVSKHHYSTHLAKRGNIVYFLNPPSNTLSVEPSGIENLFVVNYKGFIGGLRFFPRFMRRFFMRTVFYKLQQLTKTCFHVVWAFDNSVFFDFHVFGKMTLTISHIVDPNQNFNTRLAAKTASICLCNTDLLRNRLSQWNKNVFKINHGYYVSQTSKNISLPGRNAIKAIYVGNLNIPYLDWEILCRLVGENANVDFIFVGPGFREPAVQSESRGQYKGLIASYSNFYDVGRVSSDSVQAYLRGGDILLVCYQERFQNDQTANTHKLMEYLGSGKVIVATFTAEYSDLRQQGLIAMSTQNREFPALFKDVLANLPFWNDSGKQRARIDIALENTYEKQIEKIENVLDYKARVVNEQHEI